MVVSKGITLKNIILWTWHHIVWLLSVMGGIATMYHFGYIEFTIPWLPVSVIGTAVAFYVGFKNNQAYDRMWEARKIWGGIVNESRTWGMMIDSYVSNQFATDQVKPEVLAQTKKRLIYRHIAWLYAHRSQLLVPTSWEHISQGGHTARFARRYQERFGVGLLDDEITRDELKQFLQEDEHDRLVAAVNTATQIVNEQSRDLAKLRAQGLIDDFRHVELENILRSLYTLQGKNERIKKFPLPRQYANLSRYFVGIFISLLPFSMIPVLTHEGDLGFWLSIPITALIGWVYVMMEIVGDYSENPFQGMANDIPMMSLCRVIEIDLLEMLGDENLPDPIQAKNGVLM